MFWLLFLTEGKQLFGMILSTAVSGNYSWRLEVPMKKQISHTSYKSMLIQRKVTVVSNNLTFNTTNFFFAFLSPLADSLYVLHS